MRVLLTFRGLPGSGKTTFIKRNSLEDYVISPDAIRKLYSAPQLKVDGGLTINQSNDRKVWNLVSEALEHRMKNGDFTVLDCCNCSTNTIRGYKNLIDKYKYRVYCIDLTDISPEICKERNAVRPLIERVPDEVIDRMYNNLVEQNMPSFVTMLSPDAYKDILLHPLDLSNYPSVHVIGDIHGCYTALKEYLDTYVKEEDAVIFTGDYLDRGIENTAVIKWLDANIDNKRYFFLEGNHEVHIRSYAYNERASSAEFEEFTKPCFVSAGVTNKRAKVLYKKFIQMCWFTHKGDNFIVTHGGITSLTKNPLYISASQMIKGVGGYKDSLTVDETFKGDTYSIHGHRNVEGSPVHNTEYSYNLEGAVEFGGHLRAIKINEEGITPIEVKNNVYKDYKPLTAPKDMPDYILALENNPFIKKVKCGNIVSYNYSDKVFYESLWNDMTVKARGLFIDKSTKRIAARSYDKFFNYNEQYADLENLSYPLKAYVKENGFLGLIGWNNSLQDIFFTSKGSMLGEHSTLFAKIMDKYYSSSIPLITEYIQDNDVSFVFEVIDSINDPHIISYENPKVVLLDIIQNDITFSKIPYEELKEIAAKFKLPVKEHAFNINSKQELTTLLSNVPDKHKDVYVEGFVLEDSKGYMFKVKNTYYKRWKHLRTVCARVIKYGDVSRLNEENKAFIEYCLDIRSKLSPAKRLTYNVNILKLRKEFESLEQSRL